MTAMLEKTTTDEIADEIADEITEETAEEIIGGSKTIQQAITKMVGGKSVTMTPEMAC